MINDEQSETGQTNDCEGNYQYKVYTKMQLEQTLVTRGKTIFYDYEENK